MDIKTMKIMNTEKADLEYDMEKIRGVLIDNKGIDTLPIEVSESIRRILVSELNVLESEKSQIENDLGEQIDFDIGTAEKDEVTEKNDYVENVEGELRALQYADEVDDLTGERQENFCN